MSRSHTVKSSCRDTASVRSAVDPKRRDGGRRAMSQRCRDGHRGRESGARGIRHSVCDSDHYAPAVVLAFGDRSVSTHQYPGASSAVARSWSLRTDDLFILIRDQPGTAASPVDRKGVLVGIKRCSPTQSGGSGNRLARPQYRPQRLPTDRKYGRVPGAGNRRHDADIRRCG